MIWTSDWTPPIDGVLAASFAGAQITLTWTPATDNISGLSTRYPYRLVRAEGSAPPADCLATPKYHGLGLNYGDTDVAYGHTYSYRLCAYDNAGNTSTGATTTVNVPYVYHPLTLTIGGTGTGTVGIQGNLTVVRESTYGLVQDGTAVTLFAQSDACSQTVGFRGACYSNSPNTKTSQCSFLMSGPMDVAIDFDVTKKVLNFTTHTYAPSLQSAIIFAGDYEMIGLQSTYAGPDILFNFPKHLYIRGGYDCDHNDVIPGGFSKIGSLTISQGALSLDNIEIVSIPGTNLDCLEILRQIMNGQLPPHTTCN